MTKFNKIAILMMTLATGCTFACTTAIFKNHTRNHGSPKAKNIIFMVPDGQGLSNVTAARIYKNGVDGGPLYQETLENIGYQRTYSANATVTDSAAAASAWAVGEKFDNNEVSCHTAGPGKCENLKPTILELAGAMGKATGLVASAQISHATSAAFGAHSTSRSCGTEIARQYIEVAAVDVILGGGLLDTRQSGAGCEAYVESYRAVSFVDGRDDMISSTNYIIGLAKRRGYAYVSDEADMNDVASSGHGKKVTKVLGMFQQAGPGLGKTPEMFRIGGDELPPGEPTLAEMTAAALGILENDRDGMFLLVEGSQVDWANHDNKLDFQIAESLAFDESVKVVLDWVNADQDREKHTLIIVVADHDCGGFAVNGPTNKLPAAGELVDAGWTSRNHTGVDTIIYSQGPGSEQLNAAVDNTDLYKVMESVLH